MVSKSPDKLHVLLKRISNALGMMTRTIIKRHCGFSGRFCFGIPELVAGCDSWPAACRAAPQIQQLFEQTGEKPGAPLKNK